MTKIHAQKVCLNIVGVSFNAWAEYVIPYIGRLADLRG